MQKIDDKFKTDVPEKLKTLRVVRDFEWHGWHLLSELQGDEEEYYWTVWMDCDNNLNRWTFFKIDNPPSPENFIALNQSFVSLIKKSNNAFICDIDTSGKIVNCYNVDIETIEKCLT